MRWGGGGISKKNRVCVANISDECIIGLDTMRMFKMILDVGKGMVGANEKVLPGCFKYVGGAEVETVRRVELEPSLSQKFQSQLKGIQKGAGYWSRVFRIVVFSCQVL